ncbi:MAG: hypothetical protein RJA57_1395 [Bacteroidota bacterium]|jgi:nucleoside-diphosphate-sugar epimerase
MSIQNVLVTGGTGFLGAYTIAALLEKGCTVRAIRRTPHLPHFVPASLMGRVEWVEGNILDVVSLEDAMRGMDAVIHAAAMVSFRRKDRRSLYQVNVDGTANVVNMALEAGIRRLVHISSVAALGRTANGEHVNEEKKWEETALNTHYARSKYKAELEVWRGMGEGLDAVILNPSTILGYGDWHTGSAAIFHRIYKGVNWYTQGLNGFVDVEDAARATVALLTADIREERFIVNGDNWEFRKLQETIAATFGKRPPVRAARPWQLALAWRFEQLRSRYTGERPLLTRESARVAMSRTWFDNSKLLRILPDFRYTPLEETIRKACEKYRSDQPD